MAPVSLTEVGETGGHRVLFPRREQGVMATSSRSSEVAESDEVGHRVLPAEAGGAWWLPIRLASSERDEAGRHRVLPSEEGRA